MNEVQGSLVTARQGKGLVEGQLRPPQGGVGSVRLHSILNGGSPYSGNGKRGGPAGADTRPANASASMPGSEVSPGFNRGASDMNHGLPREAIHPLKPLNLFDGRCFLESPSSRVITVVSALYAR